MFRLFKYKQKRVMKPRLDHYAKLHKAFDTTMAVCCSSTSALVDTPLSRKIVSSRMVDYQKHSVAALAGVGELRVFLGKLSSHMKEKDIECLDARTAIKHIMSKTGTGNCEHQSFYLAALLRQEHIPAIICNIEDMNHTVVITNDYILDPWIGKMFPLTTIDFAKVYDSSCLLTPSWLNKLLSNEEIPYSSILDTNIWKHFFVKEESVDKDSGINLF